MSKITEAQAVLAALQLPAAQQNEIAALTLLVLAQLDDNTPWSGAKRQSLRIHDMMQAMSSRFGNLYVLTVTLCEFMSKFYERCRPAARNEEMIIILAQLQQHVYELLLGWITSSVYSPLRAAQLKIHEETASDLPSMEYTASALSWLVFGTDAGTNYQNEATA